MAEYQNIFTRVQTVYTPHHGVPLSVNAQERGEPGYGERRYGVRTRGALSAGHERPPRSRDGTRSGAKDRWAGNPSNGWGERVGADSKDGRKPGRA